MTSRDRIFQQTGVTGDVTFKCSELNQKIVSIVEDMMESN